MMLKSSICTSIAGKFKKKGVVEKLRMRAGDARTIYDLIKEMHAVGVKSFCCSPAFDLFEIHKDDLTHEGAGVVGGAHFVEEFTSGEGKVLTF